MSKNMNVPKLRFKEFIGEWEEQQLGSLTTLMQSGLSRLLSDSDIGLPVIRSNNMVEGKLDVNDIKYWYKDDTQGANTENYFLKDDDLLVNFINSLAQIGKVAKYQNLLNRDVIFTTNIMRLRFKENIDSTFIFNFCHTKKYENYIQSITKPAVNQASFTTKDFNKLLITMPSKQEQEKIASFLISIDTKIEQLTKKEELLKQYKKGVMQKIFKQEIRFKADDGSEFCEWEEKKLGQIGKFYAGGDLTKLNYSKEKSNEYVYPIYANGSGEGLYGYATTFQYKSNCVTVSGRGTLGHANLRKENFNAIVRLIVIEPKSNICGNFLKEAINRINFSIESTGVPQLTIPQISLYKVFLPCLEEQNKIANFLSSIDCKIEQTQKQLESSKEFKKALLQQMFV